jgi:hypothetical protein
MKLVAFSAIVSFCLALGSRLEDELTGPLDSKHRALSRSIVLVMEGVGIPLVLAVVALPMLQKGPLKDWLIRILLLVPVSFTLFTIPGIFLVSAILHYRSGQLAGDDPGTLVKAGSISLGCFIVLGWMFLHLLRRAVPGRCPECRPCSQVSRSREG